MVHEYEGGWTEHLLETLWAYQSSSKTATKLSPFSLVYGTEAISLVELLVPTPRVVHGQETDVNAATCAKIELQTLKLWRRHEILPITAPSGISSRWPMLTTKPRNPRFLPKDKWF